MKRLQARKQAREADKRRSVHLRTQKDQQAQIMPVGVLGGQTWLGCCQVSVTKCCHTGNWWCGASGNWTRHHCPHGN